MRQRTVATRDEIVELLRAEEVGADDVLGNSAALISPVSISAVIVPWKLEGPVIFIFAPGTGSISNETVLSTL